MANLTPIMAVVVHWPINELQKSRHLITLCHNRTGRNINDKKSLSALHLKKDRKVKKCAKKYNFIH